MTTFLLGAIAMAAAIAGLVFLRFYRRTGDRFFLYFAASFWLEAVGRSAAASSQAFDDGGGVVYVLRVIAYGLILAAILDKNLPARRKP